MTKRNTDTYELNMSEFRAEWVTALSASSRLKGQIIAFTSACHVLDDAAHDIFTAHGADVTVGGADCHIFVDIPKSNIITDASRVIAVYTAAVDGGNDTYMTVNLPPLYGAGLPEGFGADDSIVFDDTHPKLHVIDFFSLLISAVSSYKIGSYGIGDIEFEKLVCREDAVRTLRLLKTHPERRFYDDTSYNGELRRLQKAQLLCLLELDRICRENGIQYFLGGGTLLGAVRHGGFIPWDDDIDVMMTRENFDRLSVIAPEKVGGGFFFQNSKTDPHYHSPFSKLRLLNTRFVTEFSSRFPEMHNEVWIDIFAHDGAPKNTALLKLHIFATRLLRSMVFHKWDGSPLHFYGKLRGICRIVSRYVRRTPIEKLEHLERGVMTLYNSKNSRYCYDGMGEHLGHGNFRADILSDSVNIAFEGHLFPVPKDYDAYLRFSYGNNYMTWPSPSKRYSHHNAVEFDLGSTVMREDPTNIK